MKRELSKMPSGVRSKKLNRKPAPAADPAAAYPLCLDLVAAIERQLHCGSCRYRSRSTGRAFRRLWDVVNAFLLDDLTISPVGRPAGPPSQHRGVNYY